MEVAYHFDKVTVTPHSESQYLRLLAQSSHSQEEIDEIYLKLKTVDVLAITQG